VYLFVLFASTLAQNRYRVLPRDFLVIFFISFIKIHLQVHVHLLVLLGLQRGCPSSCFHRGLPFQVIFLKEGPNLHRHWGHFDCTQGGTRTALLSQIFSWGNPAYTLFRDISLVSWTAAGAAIFFYFLLLVALSLPPGMIHLPSRRCWDLHLLQNSCQGCPCFPAHERQSFTVHVYVDTCLHPY
jgi:hypothetical protein